MQTCCNKTIIIIRKRLLGFAAVLFVIYEIVAFYKIHVLMPYQDFKLRYNRIIVAVAFAWAALLIELITARSEGETIPKVIFNASDGKANKIKADKESDDLVYLLFHFNL